MTLFDVLAGALSGYFSNPAWLSYTGLVLSFAGLLIGLSRYGLYRTGDRERYRDSGPWFERTGYATLIIGLLLTGAAASITPTAGTTTVYLGGSPNIGHCLDSYNIACWNLGGQNQNSGTVSSSNSTLCTSGATSPCSPACNGSFYQNWGRCEEGSASCTVTSGNTVCSVTTVTYSTAFTNAPARSDITITPAHPVTSTITKTIPASYAQSNFLTVESAGQTWLNMPAAQTEFFGDALGQHRIIVDWGNMTGVDFVVDCSVGSANAGAVLDVQYSEDAGITWTTISGITVTVSNTLCGLAEPLDWGAEAGTCLTTSGWGCYQSIPTAARKQGTWLRVVGTSGNGAGDNPVFQQAYVLTRTDSSTFTLGISCLPDAGPGPLPKLAFNLNAVCSTAPASSFTVTVGWKVWVPIG